MADTLSAFLNTVVAATPEIAALLTELGFGAVEDLGPAQLAARFFNRPDIPPGTPGGHVLRALR